MSNSDCMPQDGVSDHHKKLEPFVGTFKAQVKLWMGPGDPMVSTGVMTNSWVLGGRFLKQDYRGDQQGQPMPPFEGHGYWGFNNTTGKYEGFWIDNASTMMQTEVGAIESSGKVWTMVGEMTNPQTKQPLSKRSVITLHDVDHHDLEMYFSGPDGKESKAMEIKYERA